LEIFINNFDDRIAEMGKKFKEEEEKLQNQFNDRSTK
jgi:hypothetical protein